MGLIEKLFSGIQYLLPHHLLSRLVYAFMRIRWAPFKNTQIAIIGSLVGVGTTLVAAIIALPLAVITIAAGWMTYRPLVGASLLAAGVLVFYGLYRLGRWRERKNAMYADDY